MKLKIEIEIDTSSDDASGLLLDLAKFSNKHGPDAAHARKLLETHGVGAQKSDLSKKIEDAYLDEPKTEEEPDPAELKDLQRETGPAETSPEPRRHSQPGEGRKRRTKVEIAYDVALTEMIAQLDDGFDASAYADVTVAYAKVMEALDGHADAQEEEGDGYPDPDEKPTGGETKAEDTSGYQDEPGGEAEDTSAPEWTIEAMRSEVMKANGVLGNKGVKEILSRYGKGLSAIDEGDRAEAMQELRDQVETMA
jgi:hypothetical protein